MSELSFPLQDEVFIEDVECVGRQRGRYVTVTPQRELFLESEVDVGDVPGPKFVQTTDLDVPGRPVGTDLASAPIWRWKYRSGYPSRPNTLATTLTPQGRPGATG